MPDERNKFGAERHLQPGDFGFKAPKPKAQRPKKITFNPNGRCPICRNPFHSAQCPHSHGYVTSLVEQANCQHDLQKVIRNAR